MLIKTYIPLTILSLLFCNSGKSQDYKTYIDSIDSYKQHIDSLISLFYADPAAMLVHTVAHYNCPNGERGANAELYQDMKSNNTYKLEYLSGCDSVYDDKAYYFINNKIILVLINSQFGLGSRRTKYFKQDILISENHMPVKAHVSNDTDLEKGYEIFNDIREFKHSR